MYSQFLQQVKTILVTFFITEVYQIIFLPEVSPKLSYSLKSKVKSTVSRHLLEVFVEFELNNALR
jgi:hypothetical protein